MVLAFLGEACFNTNELVANQSTSLNARVSQDAQTQSLTFKVRARACRRHEQIKYSDPYSSFITML